MNTKILMLLMIMVIVRWANCWRTEVEFSGTLECPHPKFCALIYYREDDYLDVDEDTAFIALHCTLHHTLTHNATVVYARGDGMTNVYEPFVEVYHDCQHPLIRSRFWLDEIFVKDKTDSMQYKVRLPTQTNMTPGNMSAHTTSFAVRDMLRAHALRIGTHESRHILYQWFHNGVIPEKYYPTIPAQELAELNKEWCTNDADNVLPWQVQRCIDLN